MSDQPTPEQMAQMQAQAAQAFQQRLNALAQPVSLEMQLFGAPGQQKMVIMKWTRPTDVTEFGMVPDDVINFGHKFIEVGEQAKTGLTVVQRPGLVVPR